MLLVVITIGYPIISEKPFVISVRQWIFTTNGNEKLTVVPASGSAIYDADGNAANQNQDHNNSIYLADKTPAKIVKSKLLFNEHIDINS